MLYYSESNELISFLFFFCHRPGIISSISFVFIETDVDCVEDIQSNCEQSNTPFEVLIQGQTNSRLVRSLLTEDSSAVEATDPKKRSTVQVYTPRADDVVFLIDDVSQLAEEQPQEAAQIEDDKKVIKRETDGEESIDVAVDEEKKDETKKDDAAAEPTVGQALLPIAPIGLKLLPLQLKGLNLGLFKTNLGIQKGNFQSSTHNINLIEPFRIFINSIELFLIFRIDLLKTNTLLPFQVKLAGLKTRLGLLVRKHFF